MRYWLTNTTIYPLNERFQRLTYKIAKTYEPQPTFCMLSYYHPKLYIIENEDFTQFSMMDLPQYPDDDTFTFNSSTDEHSYEYTYWTDSKGTLYSHVPEYYVMFKNCPNYVSNIDHLERKTIECQNKLAICPVFFVINCPKFDIKNHHISFDEIKKIDKIPTNNLEIYYDHWISYLKTSYVQINTPTKIMRIENNLIITTDHQNDPGIELKTNTQIIDLQTQIAKLNEHIMIIQKESKNNILSTYTNTSYTVYYKDLFIAIILMYGAIAFISILMNYYVGYYKF